jgi:hypothetical protein
MQEIYAPAFDTAGTSLTGRRGPTHLRAILVNGRQNMSITLYDLAGAEAGPPVQPVLLAHSNGTRP